MRQAPTARAYSYGIDSGDRIASVGRDWLCFARENAAPQLTAEATVGRPLFEFVAGIETREIYRMILERVRKTGDAALIPFRCDGPRVRRFMELDVSPGADGLITFTGRTIREELREAVKLFDVSTDRGDDYVTVCSWCKRIKIDDVWSDVERAVERAELFSRTRLPRLTHGICGECASRFEGVRP